jgi:hypothetical protein
MRRIALLLGVMAALLVASSQASADPLKVNCPNGTDWESTTVSDAAASIWPFIFDNTPWEDEADFRDSAVAPIDKNQDGLVCLKTNAQSNPNAKWANFPFFLLRDNSANAG